MKKEIIEVPQWYKNGGMIVNRDCLPISSPECTYNYIKLKLNLEPEDYGVFHPLKEKYAHLSKEKLIAKVIELENELESLESSSAY